MSHNDDSPKLQRGATFVEMSHNDDSPELQGSVTFVENSRMRIGKSSRGAPPL